MGCCSSAKNQQYITMKNGVQMPILGYGTWLSNDEEALRESLRVALDAGYRHIDTAYFYMNEHVVGEVLKDYFDSGRLKREDVFITTKLPWFMNRPDLAEIAIRKSLEDLQVDYVDLYLIHLATSLKPNSDYTGPEVGPDGLQVVDDVDIVDTWRVLEKYYKKGLFKAIGVSNFTARQLQYVYDNAEIKPMNNQVELHILFPQFKLVEFCSKLGVSVTSFSTLGSPARIENGLTFIDGDCLNHPLVLELSDKYNKSPAQILLRHVIQRGVAVIPKSLNAERIRENFDVFDFEISQDDQKRLMNIGTNTRLHVFDFLAHHPEYPFKEEF